VNSTADSIAGFEHEHVLTRFGQFDRRREPGRAGADDGYVDARIHVRPS
jgi:hypothetical protein